MATQPIILLTFSNDEDAYLRMIVAEQKAIKKALLDFADKNYLQVRDVQRASTEEVFYLVNRYHNRVHILHYGGHADGQSLQLEKEIGVVQSANVKGIAGLLGTQKELKLVFLNGCATKGQVKALLDGGVQAVIATQVSIRDEKAQQFAAQFYEALATGSTVREAFRKARAFIESQEGAPVIKGVEETRGAEFEGVAEELPWGLYWRKEGEAVLDWKLPKESPLELDFSTDAISGKQQDGVNAILVDTILKAIRESWFVKELARKINRERQAGNANRKPADAEKKDAIIRSYLAPVSVHLRTLFSSRLPEKYSEERLQQLLATYEKAIELLSFIMLSDLWDAVLKRRKPLDISEGERLQLQAFFNLNEFSAPGFDYFLLADALLKIANRNNVRFYLSPLNAYPEGWLGKEQLAKANEHFQFMKTVLEEDVPSRLIGPYHVQSEQQLANVLSELSFLIQYKMAVIKNIEVQRIRNMPPTLFKHAMVELDNDFNDYGRKDHWQDLEEPTDMESVLLYQDKLNNNLNLSPFVLDENALTREFNYKIYFFSHRTEAGLVYRWVENEKDTLVITEKKYAYVLQQFEKARQNILNEKGGPAKRSDITDEDDILTLM